MSTQQTFLAALGITVLLSAPALPAQQIGEAVAVKTTVTGQNGPLRVRAPVHQDERIRTSNTGLGEFVFRDGTKFAVGWGSSIVLDSFVYDGSRSAKKFSVKAAKGTFRWISGKSRSSAYEIVTTAGTLGIRGTAFDLFVGTNGIAAVVLYNGSVRFCGTNGCRNLTRRCDIIIASRANGVSSPRPVSREALASLGVQRALPFLTGAQRVSNRFRVPGSDCGLATRRLDQPERTEDRGTRNAQVTPPPGPGPAPAPEPVPPVEVAGHPNNGIGNGGGDGSPNGRNDRDR
jgi:hypothetical protein